MKIRGRIAIALATTTLMGGLASPVLAADTVWAPCQGSNGTGSTMTFQIILTGTF